MKRERVTILVEVDLDPVPGWGNDPKDWVEMIQRNLDARVSHYNPVVKLSQPHENFTNQGLVGYDKPMFGEQCENRLASGE